MSRRRIVVVGGGFAGVWAAVAAAEEREAQGGAADVDVVLVSRDDHLTVRPQLYETDLTDVRQPLHPVLGPRGVELRLGEVTGIDPAERLVRLGDGSAVAYDVVVVAAGSAAPRRVTSSDGTTVHLVDTEPDAVALQAHLASHPGPVVVVDAGLAGVELAAELVSRHEVHLVDASPDLGHHGEVGAHLASELAGLGVRLVLGQRVVDVAGGVVRTDGAAVLRADTVVDTSGMRASPLVAALGAPLDELGRVVVPATLVVPGHADALVAGDVAHVEAAPGHVAPMSCQCAMPMGTVAGRNAVRTLTGAPLDRYEQPGYVTCIDLGAAGAVFTRGWDRVVELGGADAKAIKRAIVHDLIQPARAVATPAGT